MKTLFIRKRRSAIGFGLNDASNGNEVSIRNIGIGADRLRRLAERERFSFRRENISLARRAGWVVAVVNARDDVICRCVLRGELTNEKSERGKKQTRVE